MATIWRDDLAPANPWAPTRLVPGMAFRVEAWLREDVSIDGVSMPRGDRLCYLLTANGGPELRGWGFIRRHANGHQLGLTQDEAVELAQAMAFVDGLEAAGVHARREIRAWLQRYQERWGEIPLQARRGLLAVLLAVAMSMVVIDEATAADPQLPCPPIELEREDGE